MMTQATLYEQITQQRECILALWQAAALPSKRGLAAGFSKGSHFNALSDELLREKIDLLLEWLVSEDEPAGARAHLREICKVKAVQVQDPSEALGFILDLKGIVRLTLEKTEEFEELDKRIDQLMLLAFNEYSECRERLTQIRIEEIRRLKGRTTL